MANPWSLYFDENGNPLPGLYDAASTPDSEGEDRAPAGILPQKLSDSITRIKQPSGTNTQESVNSSSPAGPIAGPMGYFQGLDPSVIQGQMQATGSKPGAFGMSAQDLEKLTQGQTLTDKNLIFQTPERARLNMLSAMGQYARPAIDPKTGREATDASGNVIYNPDDTWTDPNHPFQQGKQNIDEMRKLLLDRIKYAPNQTDITPFLAWADANSNPGLNAHLADHYKPHTYDQTANTAMSGMDELQKRNEDLYKTAAQSAEHMQAGQQSAAQMAQLQQLMSAGYGGGRMNPATSVNNFMNQTYKESHGLQDNDTQLQKVLVSVNSGNPSEQKGVPLMIARIIEGARPAMAAASVESGDPSLSQRIMAVGTKLSDGTLTAENVGQYTQFLKDMQHVNDLAKQGMLKRWRTSGTAMGIPSETVEGMIPQEWIHPYSAQTGSIMASSPKPNNIQKPGLSKPVQLDPEADGVAAEIARRQKAKAGQ